jgi:hypothetical protein
MTCNNLNSTLEHAQKEYCAREFLKIAKQDLIAAKVLYKNELYPEALFFLQQSIEKGYKAYHLLSELNNDRQNITGKNLSIRKIGHIPTKIAEKQAAVMADRFQKIKNDIDKFPNRDEIYAAIDIDFPELIQQFHDSRDTYSDLSSSRNVSKKISLRELDGIINTLKICIRNSNTAFRNIKNSTYDEATLDEMKRNSERIMLPMLKSSPDLIEKEKDKLNKIFGKDFPKYEYLIKITIQNRLESGCVNTIYSNLSIITQTHESSTRYPEENNSPLRNYSGWHPLIKRFIVLSRLAGIAHKKFDGILSSAEKLQ